MVEQASRISRLVAFERVLDDQLDLPTGRPEAVLGHGHARALTDHVAPEADPVLPRQLEAQAGHLAQDPGEGASGGGRLQQQESRLQAPRMGHEPPQQRGVASPQAGRQVHHQQVDRPTGEERPGQSEAFLRIRRSQHHEPAQVHATCHRLEGIEGLPEIQPRCQGPTGLRLGQGAQGERGLARRGAAPYDRRRTPWQTARAECGIERREAGRDDRLKPRGGGGGQWRLAGQQGQRPLHGGGRWPGHRLTHRCDAAQPDGRAAPTRLQAGQRSLQGGFRVRRRDGDDRADAGLHGPANDRTAVLSVKPGGALPPARRADPPAPRDGPRTRSDPPLAIRPAEPVRRSAGGR